MLGLDAGWTVEAASFTAAAAVGCAGRVLRARLGIASTALAVSGCIPMVPGSFAAQAIFGLFELTSLHLDDPGKVAMTTMEFTLRVIFTIGAIGAGLSMATHIFRSEFHD